MNVFSGRKLICTYKFSCGERDWVSSNWESTGEMDTYCKPHQHWRNVVRTCGWAIGMSVRVYVYACLCWILIKLSHTHTHTRLSPKDTSEATHYALIRTMPIWECTVCRRMSQWLVATDWSPTPLTEFINHLSSCCLAWQDSKNCWGVRDFTTTSLLPLNNTFYLSSSVP